MAKGKGKRIPVALHGELTEYSSLLRALRTGSTLDVSSQISKHFESSTTVVENDEDHSKDEEEPRPTSPVASPSSQPPSPSPIVTSKHKHNDTGTSARTPAQTAKKKRKQIQADIWTKWPLLPEDLIRPQWGLEDEISVMASQRQKQNQPESDEEEDDKEYLPHLHLSTSNCLEAILASVVAHTPLRADSMQNRLNPIDWRFVLNVLVSQKVVHPEVIERAEMRLRSMYDASGTVSLHASRRAQQTIKSRNKLADLLAPHDSSLFTLAERLPTPELQLEPTESQVKKEKKEKRGKRVSRVPRRRKTTRKRLEST
ncbi:uncharacterized protein BT62DRAFT_363007 [Guyanagaster necrorhizus]|uniref:Uncharacterized protein n=1 Tax=Guyanagaster necrorhizus TaxID=856835 RepID=A0A9P8AQI2_9AGAR|nr:uncharacterized protein BT62DRAFT_363007 [Guyanagaster necrorhizus MCA 3950]KAG7442897.1 hypothetical protein BT62DRAFT_363007 [Guyanagaster necrorhizus MCA 3950]